MSGAPESICFYCSQPFLLAGRFNRTSDGRPCPVCSERLLETLPPLIPVHDETSALEPAAPRPVLGPRALDDEVPSRRPRLLRSTDDRPEPA